MESTGNPDLRSSPKLRGSNKMHLHVHPHPASGPTPRVGFPPLPGERVKNRSPLPGGEGQREGRASPVSRLRRSGGGSLSSTTAPYSVPVPVRRTSLFLKGSNQR